MYKRQLSDHVGLVGDDGKTHHGVLSVPMLMSIPNLTLLAPRDTRQIRQAVRATLKLDGPCVVQYPTVSYTHLAADCAFLPDRRVYRRRKG